MKILVPRLNDLLHLHHGSRPRLLAFIYLIQDLDVLLPSLLKLKAFGADVSVFVCPGIVKKSPRVVKALEENGLKWFSHSRWKWFTRTLPSVLGYQILLTAADTSAGPHAPAHELVLEAKAAGLQTFTFQHGLENIGLTYSDAEYPAGSVQFASDIVFIWGQVSDLHPAVSRETKSKCISVGCPKDFSRNIEKPMFQHKGRRLIVIFENLHWGRYSDLYRTQFIEDLYSRAREYPDVTFLVKPHHAGRWLTEKRKGKTPELKNLIVADPRDPKWEPYTAPALIAMADAIITTPSTTAFDASKMEKKVAVVGYDLDLSYYAPLACLRASDDWRQFIDETLDNKQLEFISRMQTFLNRVSLSGDGASRVANFILNGTTQEKAPTREESPSVETKRDRLPERVLGRVRDQMVQRVANARGRAGWRGFLPSLRALRSHIMTWLSVYWG